MERAEGWMSEKQDKQWSRVTCNSYSERRDGEELGRWVANREQGRDGW